MRLDISMGYYGGLQRALLVYGWYEPQFTRVITQELKEGMTVVDIGANVGYYVLLEAEIVGDTGKVYAIEPVPEIVERLKENVSLNSLTNVEIYQLAIGNRNSKTKCYLSKSPNLSNLLGTTEKSGPKSRYIGTIEVAETTLDDFLKDKRAPDLVRMDIEGYEYFAIEGGEKLLSEKRNMKIFMELHPRDMEKAGLKLEVMLDRLYHVGFKPKYLTKKGDSWLNPLSDSIDINSSRFEGSLADLLRKIEHADGLFMEKVI
jgi:FkbM family methyltransferase